MNRYHQKLWYDFVCKAIDTAPRPDQVTIPEITQASGFCFGPRRKWVYYRLELLIQAGILKKKSQPGYQNLYTITDKARMKFTPGPWTANKGIVFHAYPPQSSLLERELIARQAYIRSRIYELKNPNIPGRSQKTLVYKSIWIERRIDRLKSELNS